TGILQPKYDMQEDIYNGILADLEAANALFDESAGTVVGDILYSGDLLKWKKLANSLRLRYLMRISNKVDVKAAMQAIISDPATTPICDEANKNADNGTLTYLTTAPNQ